MTARNFDHDITFFHNIAEHARDIILALEFDGSICYANEAAVSAYGYSRNELCRMHIRDLRAPQTSGENDQYLKTAKENQIEFQTRHLRRNGNIFPVEVRTWNIQRANSELIISIVRDITDTFILEQKNCAAKDYAQKLLDTSNSMVVTLDMEGLIKVFNEEAERITGYSRAEVLGKKWVDIMIPQDQYARTCEYLQSAAVPDYCKNFANQILTKSCEVRHISWQSSLIGDHKNVVGIIGFGIDITEQKHAGEKLRQEEEFVKGIIDGLDTSFFAVDMEYRYLIFNQTHFRRMQELFGVTIEVGKSVLDYHLDVSYRMRAKQNIDQALAGETCIVEDYVGDARTVKKFSLVEHIPIKDSQQQIIGAAVFCRDVTELRLLELEAQSCHLRYRQLVEDTQVIAMAVNAEGKIGFINDYGLKFFGFPADELLNHTAEETILPEVDSLGRNLWLLYRNLRLSIDGELREIHENRRKSGKRIWVDWTVRRGVNPLTGEPGWLCVGVDETANRRAHEEEKMRFERRRCREFMNDIIAGRIAEEDIQQSANQLGLDLNVPFVCIVVEKPEFAGNVEAESEKQFELDILVDRLNLLSKGIVWEEAGRIAALVPCGPKERTVIAQETKMHVAEFWTLLQANKYFVIESMGVAHQTSSLEQISTLYEHALAALEMGSIQNPDEGIHYWHELGWLRLLVQNYKSAEAKQFVDDYLGPLLAMPQPDKREVLFDTLQLLLSGDGVDSIAKRLNVHSQTVRYRKRLLEELLGVSFAEGSAITNLHIALKILTMQKIVQ